MEKTNKLNNSCFVFSFMVVVKAEKHQKSQNAQMTPDRRTLFNQLNTELTQTTIFISSCSE